MRQRIAPASPQCPWRLEAGAAAGCQHLWAAALHGAALCSGSSIRGALFSTPFVITLPYHSILLECGMVPFQRFLHAFTSAHSLFPLQKWAHTSQGRAVELSLIMKMF